MIAEYTRKMSEVQRHMSPNPVERVRMAVQKCLDESPYRAAAVAAGFKFGAVRLEAGQHRHFDVRLTVPFECVCGRDERWIEILPFDMLENVSSFYDAAEKIYAFGSFSEPHLLADGYSAEDATRIAAVVEEELRLRLRGHRTPYWRGAARG